MERPLAGHLILVVEDEPLIALDIRDAFEEHGAETICVHTIATALIAVTQPGLSAAILDTILADGDSSEICVRLKEQGVPYMTYSGFSKVEGPCGDAAHVTKPATAAELVATIRELLSGQPQAV